MMSQDKKQKRTIWLDWVGGASYSIKSFIAEAEKMGVSRRLSRKLLSTMGWGDRVYVCARPPQRKAPEVFGYYEVESILGMDWADVPDELKDKIMPVERDAFVEPRGCGMVVSGGCYVVTGLGIETLADYTKEPQVRGGLKVLPKPWPKIRGMPPFRGVRRFNATQFFKDFLLAGRNPNFAKHFYYG